MSEELGITVKKSDDFSEWYQQAVLKAGLADYAPIKGCMIIKPHGFAIWENVQKEFDDRFKETGHENVYFPLFIPENFLKKEAEHFEGFVPEVAWITHGGSSKLEEKLAIRPTSETIMYSVYAKWIRSYRDLPLLLNQWVNIVRWETSATRLFLRTREFLWQEGHTAHATKEEADKEVMKILNVYKDVIEDCLAIPVLVGKKTESEKFAGALYTTTLEAIMTDGKALQMGTSHNLGQNFSKVFNIKFLDKDKKEKYVWQTSWGVSTRLIGALVMAHGDDKGLVLPPKVAPLHVVIVPIVFEKKKREVLKKARQIEKKIKEANYSVKLDDREEYTPGWKYNEWEMKGVPLRIEIGPKDIKNRQVIVVRRDNGKKIVVKESKLIKEISEILDDIQKNLYRKAKKFLKDHITTVKNYEEFKKMLVDKKGFIKAYWCGKSDCEEKIKEETGATIRLIPFKKERVFSNCVCCGKKAKEVVYFAKAY